MKIKVQMLKKLNLLILMGALVWPSFSFSYTKGQYLGRQFMIDIVTNHFDGSYESMPQDLYEKMNVSEQSSFVGLGKKLDLPKDELSFICVFKNDKSYHCSFIVFVSPVGTINPREAVVQYTGVRAKEIYKQFHFKNGETVLKIEDSTATFKIIVSEDLFRLSYY